MSTDPEAARWREIAFSYEDMRAFLSVAALSYEEADQQIAFGSAAHRCFCTGFYVFAWAIKEELAPAFAEELLNLAVRVEAQRLTPTVYQWDSNAEEARRILSERFSEG
jgi:hypothetical protein